MTSEYYFSLQKRFLDVSFSLVLLCLLFPLFSVVAVFIFLESPGPIFFRQKRMGLNKKVFTLLKFRTMKHQTESDRNALERWNEAPWPMFKMRNDPRYTRVGRFLSRTGLDEFPQLVNILKNEMSIVGPRPLPLTEAKALPKHWDFRYQVKPGLISEWAVARNRYHSLATWKKLEESTLQQGSIAYDLSLMIRTIYYLSDYL
jgi:lipopolysaccharide/colanic/teichoic acid biosynthesis glycosyltransferase